jgi:hypothetical protein
VPSCAATVWAATAALLGRQRLAAAREALRERADPQPLERLARMTVGGAAVDRALTAHAARLG